MEHYKTLYDVTPLPKELCKKIADMTFFKEKIEPFAKLHKEVADRWADYDRYGISFNRFGRGLPRATVYNYLWYYWSSPNDNFPDHQYMPWKTSTGEIKDPQNDFWLAEDCDFDKFFELEKKAARMPRIKNGLAMN